MWVYVIYGSRSESIARVARSIASTVGWSNEYDARSATLVDPSQIRSPGLVFLGIASGGSELERPVRCFLDGLPERTMYDVVWAIFDTRGQQVPLVAGSGIRRLRRAVEHRGGRLLVTSESFYSDEAHGGVSHAELERARSWGSNAIAHAVKRFHDPSVRAGTLPGGPRAAWETWSPVPVYAMARVEAAARAAAPVAASVPPPRS